MAKQTIGKHVSKPRHKRPGVHAKSQQTFNKKADQYVKKNVGQGK